MANYNTDLKLVIDGLTDRPGVEIGKAFGHPCYKAPNGKLFALVGSNGLILKLPEDRVKELIEANEAIKPFSPSGDGTIVWKAWLIIDHPDAEAYHQYQDLIDESMEYVMS